MSGIQPLNRLAEVLPGTVCVNQHGGKGIGSSQRGDQLAGSIDESGLIGKIQKADRRSDAVIAVNGS